MKKLLILLKKNYFISFLILWVLGSTVGYLTLYGVYHVLYWTASLMPSILAASFVWGGTITFNIFLFRQNETGKKVWKKENLLPLILLTISIGFVIWGALLTVSMLRVLDIFSLSGAICVGAVLASHIMVWAILSKHN